MPKPWEVNWSQQPPVSPDYQVKSATVPTQIQQAGATLGKTMADTQSTIQQTRINAQKAPSEISLNRAQAAKAQQDLADEAQKEHLRKVQALMGTDRVLKAIGEARGLIGPWTTGLAGEIGQHIPATDAYALSGDLGTIKGNISFDAYKQMKENMPEGAQGGIRLTDNELKLLGSLEGFLGQGLRQKQLQSHLDNVEQGYRVQAALTAGLNPSDPRVQQALGINPNALGQMTQTVNVNGETPKISKPKPSNLPAGWSVQQVGP